MLEAGVPRTFVCKNPVSAKHRKMRFACDPYFLKGALRTKLKVEIKVRFLKQLPDF